MTVFRCRRLVTPRGEVAPATLRVTDGRVAEVAGGDPDADDHDAVELDGTVVGGLVDLQVNGLEGWDVASGDADAIRAIGRGLLSRGVTAWLPTVVTSTEERRLAALDAIAEAAGDGPVTGDGPSAARVLGAHLEGPWISPARAGAHDPSSIRPPEEDEIERSLSRHPGLVRMVTLAPEVDGGLEAVRLVARSGAVVSLGHTDATAAEARAALDAGARAATHLWNAMRPLHHRDPGVVGALLDDPRAALGLIADGVHVDPLVVGLVFRLAPGRVFCVSDVVAAGADATDAVRRPDGLLAGAVAGLDAGVRTAVDAGVPLTDAVGAAAVLPRALVGEPEPLSPGAPADLVVLDDGLRPMETYLAGVRVWKEGA